MREAFIPMKMITQNERDRTHPLKVHRLKKLWTVHLKMAFGHTERRPNLPMNVHITTYRRQFIRDTPNLIGGAKHVLDAIRDACLIFDDSDKWATFTFEQRLKRERPDKKECTHIKIWPR